MDYEATEKYYLEKYRGHKKYKFSQWSLLRHFSPPKRPVMFILMAALTGSEMQTVVPVYLWAVPSIAAILLMWEVFISLIKEHDIIDRCIATEIVYEDDFASGRCNYGPSYVTAEDREAILDDHIYRHWKLPFWRELKEYWIALLMAGAFYSLVSIVLHLFVMLVAYLTCVYSIL